MSRDIDDLAIAPAYDDLSLLPLRRLQDMQRAADDLFTALHDLQAKGAHPVADVVSAADGRFTTFTYYPANGVGGAEDQYAWYYHAHDPGPDRPWEEHGHFHCFAFVDGEQQAWAAPKTPRADNRNATHLVAVCVSASGAPWRLFTLNRWASDDCLYPSEATIPLLDMFEIAHDARFEGTSRWLSALLKVLQPQVDWLLRERDRVLRAAQLRDPTGFSEDAAIEIPSMLDFDLDEHLGALERALAQQS